MSEKQNIVELIAKQLQGAATPEELNELQLWLKSDAACQQEYDDMALIWQKKRSPAGRTPVSSRSCLA